ncbi:MAG: LON peptidase substrate-binding domain-containing protein [Candidatus Sulfotelmatobacter sp.]
MSPVISSAFFLAREICSLRRRLDAIKPVDSNLPWRTIKQRQPCRCRNSVDALIPLFPLDVVLFPGTPLPLHIFEPRYKEMIGESLAQRRHFGVIRSLEQGLAKVGCTAEIITRRKRI